MYTSLASVHSVLDEIKLQEIAEREPLVKAMFEERDDQITRLQEDLEDAYERANELEDSLKLAEEHIAALEEKHGHEQL